ncbi:signal peptidase I [Blattabacterium cuenoti]|uniref:signal peptidase I n=1 Tax=Blattabacterium cuenoti TaxID=1653831 RepID=UPI00163C61A2|nr:signal peptidase I [Blattabacterium cuenoti]
MLEYIIYHSIFLLIENIIHILLTCNIYKNFNISYQKSFIPFYNIANYLKAHRRSIFYMFLLINPLTSIILYLILWIDLIYSFHKNKFSLSFLIYLIFFGFFHILYINFFRKKNDILVIKKIDIKNNNFLLSIIFSFIIQTYIIQPFFIPTSSMEKTLLVGDFILVSKIHYGLKLPILPVFIPFTFKKNNFLGLKDYFPFSFNSMQSIKRNDIIAFKFPINYENSIIDKKYNYIKRCVGIPGDTIFIKNGNLFINNKKEKNEFFSTKQQSYIIKTNKIYLNIKFLKDNMDIKKIYFLGKKYQKYYYQTTLTKEDVKKMKYLFKNKIFIEKYITPNNIKDNCIIQNKEEIIWNKDFFGPLHIPKKGDLVEINSDNAHMYKKIFPYECNKKRLINKGLKKFIKINNHYYFMMGDNRHNSYDSRYWGLVSDNQIIGPALITWMSVSWDEDNPINFLKWNIRWNRIMKKIN